ARIELAALQLLVDGGALRLARLAHGIAELPLAGPRRLELLLLGLVELELVDHALGQRADAGNHDAVAHRLELAMMAMLPRLAGLGATLGDGGGLAGGGHRLLRQRGAAEDDRG